MKRIFIILMFLAVPLALRAVNWEARGARIVGKTSTPSAGMERLILTDAKGRSFEVNHSGSISEAQAGSILLMNERFYSWKHVAIKTIEYHLTSDMIHAQVHAEKIEFRTANLKENLPSGFEFFKDDRDLTYRFRMVSGNISVRVEGVYSDEESLLAEMSGAINNIRKGDKSVPESGKAVAGDGNVALRSGSTAGARIDAGNDASSSTTPAGGSQSSGSSFSHWASVYMGSGALVTVSYSLSWHGIELSPTLGYIYYKDEDLVRQALPLGLRLGWEVPFSYWTMKPYLFAGGLYYYGLAEYDSRPMATGGLGVRFLGHFFAEGSYIYQEDGQGFALGLGARLNLGSLWR